MLLEAKAAIHPEYLHAFAEFVAGEQIFRYFPEYWGRAFIPVFSALPILDNDLARLT